MSTTHHTTGSAVVRAFVGAINARDFATLKALMAPDIEYHLLPASLSMPAAVGIEAAAGGLEQVCKFVPDFSVAINEIIEAENKVWVYGQGTGTAVDGREYKNEVVNMMDLVRDEDGSLRVKRAREFVDSKFVASFFGGAK